MKTIQTENSELRAEIARKIIGHALTLWAEYPRQSPERAAIDDLVTLLERWAGLSA